MSIVHHNPPGLFPEYRGYAHAIEVAGGSKLLFISGLNGFETDGTTMPESFGEQAELIWRHIRALIRGRQLGEHRVSSTVVCCQLLDPRWKLEIEAAAQ